MRIPSTEPRLGTSAAIGGLADPATPRGPQRPTAIVRRYLGCIRYREIVVLQGAPLCGAAFSMGALTAERLETVLVFAAASVLLVAHIFVFNDWTGVDADLNDANKAAGVFEANGIGRAAMRRLWIVLLALSLTLFAVLGARLLFIAIAIAVASFAYSRPRLPAKGVPVLGSVLHLGGGILHFLLGYSLFKPIDASGVALALFFGLSFAAGHLNQEVRDFDGDLRNGIKTNAVTFGRMPTFVAGVVVFTLAYGHLVVLAVSRTIPHYLAGLAALYVLHLYWSVRVAATGLTFESVRRFQASYRALYVLIGAALLAALLLSHGWPT